MFKSSSNTSESIFVYRLVYNYDTTTKRFCIHNYITATTRLRYFAEVNMFIFQRRCRMSQPIRTFLWRGQTLVSLTPPEIFRGCCGVSFLLLFSAEHHVSFSRCVPTSAKVYISFITRAKIPTYCKKSQRDCKKFSCRN